MSCNNCLSLIEEYVEAGLDRQTSAQVGIHLAICASCRAAYAELENERNMYVRYSLPVKEAPGSWEAVLAEIRHRKAAANIRNVRMRFYDRLSAVFFRQPVFATVVIFVLVIGIGFALFYSAVVRKDHPVPASLDEGKASSLTGVNDVASRTIPKPRSSDVQPRNDQSDLPERRRTGKAPTRVSPVATLVRHRAGQALVSFDLSDAAFERHFEKCEMLLRSFRNAVPESDKSSFDISFEKRFSKVLFRDSVRFRREAQRRGNPQVEELLASLETILRDISGLPKRTRLSDANLVKVRIHQNGIISRLQVRSSVVRSSE